MNFSIKRNHGVFEAESRLWYGNFSSPTDPGTKPLKRTCYIGIILYVVGFLILGVAIQDRLSIAVIVVGWVIAQTSVLVITVAVCEYN